MKKALLKILLTLTVAVSWCFAALAYDFTYENLLYSYMTDRSKVAVVGTTGRGTPITDLVIPSTIRVSGGTVTVSAIYPDAFSEHASITSVRIPGTVSVVYEGAFEKCPKLTTVVMDEGVWNIGNGAFHGCSALTSVKIPQSVTGMGKHVFANCESLQSVTLPDAITKIELNTFYRCKSLQSITIPERVQLVGSGAFFGCSELRVVRIPDGVAQIDSAAFKACSRLTEVEFGTGVGTMGADVFKECDSIRFIKMNSTTAPTGYPDIFSERAYLKTCLFVPHGSINSYKQTQPWSKFLPLYEVARIDSLYFNLNEAERTATLRGCVFGYRDVTVPSTVRSRGVKYTVTAVAQSAFTMLNTLRSVEVPESVTQMDSHAFYHCTELETVKLECRIRKISYDMFAYCRKLKSVELPNTLEEIFMYSFSNCSSLSSLVLPDKVKSIGRNAFMDCSSLEVVELPDSVEEVGVKCFQGCTALKSLTLGTGLQSIGDGAFTDCTSIATVYANWKGTPPVFADVFSTATYADATLCVPSGTGRAYSKVNPWSKFRHIEERESTGITTVEATDPSEADALCDVYSITGVNVATGVSAQELSRISLPSGLYVVRCANCQSKKILIK